MSKTLKQIVQETCRRGGMPLPSSVVGSTVPQVQTLLGLMNELLDDLYTRKTYQQVIREATFTSVALASQGSIHTLADTGFVMVMPGTFFNRTTGLAVEMGLSGAEWQAVEASSGVAGPFYQARLRNDQLLLSPTPAAGEAFAFEYQSNAFVLNTTTGAYQTTWEADTDTFLLPDGLAIAWLRAAYKREKGLEYAEDAIRYETFLGALGTKDNTARPIDMSGCSGRGFGAIAPEGYWVL